MKVEIVPSKEDSKFRAFLIKGLEHRITDCRFFLEKKGIFSVEYNGKPIGYEIIYSIPDVTSWSNVCCEKFIQMMIRKTNKDKLAIFVGIDRVILFKLIANNTDFLLGALEDEPQE